MYPRNAASPPRLPIGAVVQISDGAVQTSGCTVRILPEGGAEADGGGTTAYSTDGVVLYTPTQGETNYPSFILIAKKTGCIPAALAVITTDSTVTGRVNVSHVAGTTQTGGDIVAAIAAVDDLVDTEVGAIKTQTDKLTFDGDNHLASNLKKVSDDATAADKLEEYLDGTHFMPVDAHKPNWSVAGTNLTVKEPDGSTTAYTKSNVTTDVDAEPITGAS